MVKIEGILIVPSPDRNIEELECIDFHWLFSAAKLHNSFIIQSSPTNGATNHNNHNWELNSVLLEIVGLVKLNDRLIDRLGLAQLDDRSTNRLINWKTISCS